MTTFEPGDGPAVGRYFASQGIQTILHPVESAVEPMLDPDEVPPKHARNGYHDRGRDPVRDGFHIFNIP